MTSETHYQLMRLLESEPHLTQRQLAARLGVSLGKVNYCVRALLDKGLVKAGNFYRSREKTAYVYKLTPAGIAEKAQLTKRFLAIKMREYDALRVEIEQLSKEVGAADKDVSSQFSVFSDSDESQKSPRGQGGAGT